MSNTSRNKARPISATTVTAARVHTPGKYIIVFGILPLCIIASVISGAVLGGRHYQSPFAFEFRDNSEGIKTAYYPMPEILVDLAVDETGRRAFLKTRISIAVTASADDDNRDLDALRPVMTERLTIFLRALRRDDFEGTQSMVYLKSAMRDRLNIVLGRELVDDVILQNLIIQ